MLEPRRVAARMVATQMAKILGEDLGQRVGYQVKMERAYSKQTKILVVTEAVLVRMLQSDQSLERVGLVIFDEFHERSIHSDLSLALCLQVQELLREDLKILIMSATLNTKKIVSQLGDLPVINSKGKVYDVEMHYLDVKTPQPSYKTLNTQLHKTILSALKNDEGDILVFLQGLKEIKNLQQSLQESLKNEEIIVLPLYASLAKNEQDKALLPLKKRKIILATNIAQTSLTIEGVRVVIDSGLEKISRFNNATAMNHLESSFISQDAATQRAGRAGRLSSGKCYRLWHEHKVLQESTKAEILRSDLSSLLLDLALWGVEDLNELFWLDTPDAKHINKTKMVLQELQMLDKNFQITRFGKDALSLGLHPRFAYMILKATQMGYTYEACLLAALLSEKDIFKHTGGESDLALRFLHLYENNLDPRYIYVHRAKEVLKQASTLVNRVEKLKNKTIKKSFLVDNLAVLLLLAYPDRLAKRRAKNDNKYKLSNAKGALLDMEDTLFNEEFLVVANLHAQAKDSFITLALSISFEQIEKYFQEFLLLKESISYNKTSKKFDLRQSVYFLDLEISSKPLSLDAKHDIKKLLLALVKREGLGFLHWSKKALSLKARVNFVNTHKEGEFQSFSDDALLHSLDIWLEPYLTNTKSVKELQALEIYPLLLAQLTWQEQQHLQTLAPVTFQVPSGSNIFIDYSDAQKPSMSVKIQEVFGLQNTPKVLENTIALQLHLLSPAMRPIQITYDLSSFWANSYAQVRKELRGKYKRHYWPENPYEAIATKKTKKYM
jgi:ATP-dependent helicase HrpB